MPRTDEVYLFGNVDTGDALLDAAFSKKLIHRRLLLLDPTMNEGQQSSVQQRYCPPNQVVSRGTITKVRCAGYGKCRYHSLLNGCSLHDREVRRVITTLYLRYVCTNEYYKLVIYPIGKVMLQYYIQGAFTNEPKSWSTYMCVCVKIHMRVAVDRCLPAELLVPYTLYALPCHVTCRHEPLRTPNTFPTFFSLCPAHSHPILHHALPPAYKISA